MCSASHLAVHRFSIVLQPSSSEVLQVLVVNFGGGQAFQVSICEPETPSGHNLAVAFPAFSACKILGPADSADDPSQVLAERLSKKLCKPVYVGFNASAAASEATALAQIYKHVVGELAQLCC